MILAVSAMSPTLTFIFFLAAFICFILAAFGIGTRPALLPLGLALFTVPFAWAQLVLS